MNFKKHLELAWNLTLQFIVPLMLMTLIMVLVSGITMGILAPVVLAGYMQSILMMIRERREPSIQDLFSYMNLFFPLLGFGIALFILIMIGALLLVLPGIIIAVGVSFICLYMLPLMTDKKLGLVESVKESFAMVTRPPVQEHIVVLLLFMGISVIGSSVFIGWLFTQPIATIFLMSAYDELIHKSPPDVSLVQK